MLYMKTVTVRQLRHEWPKVSSLLKRGVEIEVTDHGKPVARMLPPAKKRASKRPDFYKQLKEIYGDKVCPTTGTELMQYARGET